MNDQQVLTRKQFIDSFVATYMAARLATQDAGLQGSNLPKVNYPIIAAIAANRAEESWEAYQQELETFWAEDEESDPELIEKLTRREE